MKQSNILYFGDMKEDNDEIMDTHGFSSLSEEFALMTVQDDTGRHIIKQKDFPQYFNQKIDSWFFGGDSMGAEFVLGEDTSDSWMW